MPPSILFLSSPVNTHNDNHERIPGYFRAAGWQVHCADHESLTVSALQIKAGNIIADDADVIWPLGFGPARTFADRMQLLSRLEAGRMMLTPHAFHTLHGKAAWLDHAAESHISSRAADLIAIARQRGGRWVLKPNGGSLGRQVQIIDEPRQITTVLDAAPRQYWVLQRYIPAIAEGEIRTLICGGTVLGSYRRLPNPQGIANLAAGGKPLPAAAADADEGLIAEVHARLLQLGVGFAAIDTAGGHLVETNIANPGGLQTLEQLYGRNTGPQLVEAVSARHLRGWRE